MPIRYRITTLGCRVNHAETRELESVLLSRGLEAVDRGGAAADVEVVHTCTVTGSAAAKSRQAIRRASRRPGDAVPPLVVVTGCWPSTDRAAADRLAGSGLVLEHASDAAEPTTMIDRFTHRLDTWLLAQQVPTPEPAASVIRTGVEGSSAPSPDGPAVILPLPVVPPHAAVGGHVRAELKIQDGCDAHCSFCIIPKIRSTLRSKRIADVVDETRRLVDLGHREVVLTGIFIGAYGHETALRRHQARRHASPLADLLDAVAAVPGLARLRISSMEPGDVDEPLLDAMVANAPVVVPHLHLPLQSGSDAVLRRMNRQYRSDAYLEMIEAVRSALTDESGLPPAITTDVICGFPGETEADFRRTVRVAESVGYLHMHVFPYSPRDGTAAARWTNRFVRPAEIRRRVRTLLDLEEHPDHGFSIAFRRRLAGRRVRVMLEQPRDGEPGVMTGRCDHYVLLDVRTDLPRGTLVDVRVTDVTPQRTTGVVISESVRVPLKVMDERPRSFQ